MAADVAGDPDAAYTADSRANFLDRHHQRKGKKHGPEHAVAKLRPDLRISGDPARIVVGRTGNQSRTELPKEYPLTLVGLPFFKRRSIGRE